MEKKDIIQELVDLTNEVNKSLVFYYCGKQGIKELVKVIKDKMDRCPYFEESLFGSAVIEVLEGTECDDEVVNTTFNIGKLCLEKWEEDDELGERYSMFIINIYKKYLEEYKI